jgi:uncharacterized membrane protein
MADRSNGAGATAIVASAMSLAALAGATAYFMKQPSGRGRLPDDAPDRAARDAEGPRGMTVVGRAVTIAKPRAELYAFWRDFANLPRFMENVRSVEPSGPGRHVWTIEGPVGPIPIETEVTEDRAGEIIAWRSVPGAEIETEGRVLFRDAAPGRGTVVDAEVAYRPPGGQLGRMVAKLLQREPAIQARRDLKRFKMLMETGEIAVSDHRRGE